MRVYRFVDERTMACKGKVYRFMEERFIDLWREGFMVGERGD